MSYSTRLIRFSVSTAQSARMAGVAVLLAALAMLPQSVLAQAPDAKLTFGGSGAGLGTIRILAAEFVRRNPDAALSVLPGMGSSGGIKAVIGGAVEISVSSRPLRPDEAAQGAKSVAYGKTPFVFITSMAGAQNIRSASELADIIARRTKTWPDGSLIRVVMQHPTDTDTVLLQSISTELQQALREYFAHPGTIVAAGDDDAAQKIERTPGSLGTSTLAHVITSKRRIQTVAFNGVAPSPQSIETGAYPYSKTVYLVHKELISPLAHRFIDFIASPQGQQILLATGHAIPASGR